MAGARNLAMPFPPDAPGKVRAKVEDGRLPLDAPTRMWAGHGTSKVCDGCGEPIFPSQVEYEFVMADDRTSTCASVRESLGS